MCDDFIIYLDVKTGLLTYRKNLMKKDPITISRKMGNQNLNELLTLVSYCNFDEWTPKYFSNVLETKFFKLQLTTTNNQIYEVIIDTGSEAPSSLNTLVTYFWGTSKLICFPEIYNELKY
jgi:hypothetical protein